MPTIRFLARTLKDSVEDGLVTDIFYLFNESDNWCPLCILFVNPEMIIFDRMLENEFWNLEEI